VTDQTARTPYCRKIRYGITGAPTLTEDEMDGSYAPGIGAAPTLIELVYHSARDGKPASVTASETGSWMRLGQRADGQVTVHFAGSLDSWPQWLAAEARMHDPDVPADATDRAGLREQIAKALVAWTYRGKDPEHGGILETVRANAYSRADAVLAVLPASVDRAAEEAYRLALSTALRLGTGANWEAIRDRAEDLVAEVRQLTEASRRLLEQRQEMAEERFAWQERGDRAEARVRQMEAAASVDRATVLNEAARHLYTALFPAVYADMGQKAAEGVNRAVSELRRLADETPPAEAPCCSDPTCTCNQVNAAGRCDCARWDDEPATEPAGGAQQPKEADGDRIVAYRSALPGALSVYCTNHTDELGDGVMPLTSEDLPNGGVCTKCGVDVLISQQPKEA
jgi:hypothetical protein